MTTLARLKLGRRRRMLFRAKRYSCLIRGEWCPPKYRAYWNPNL